MKKLASMAIFAASLLAVSQSVRAQDCSKLSFNDLRGTYTMSGSGFVDLSKLLAGVPGLPSLPTGLIPFSWVGADTLDPAGGGTGWVSFNAGGYQFSGALVNKKYTLKPDCSIQATYSFKSNELPGLTLGPLYRLEVPVIRQEGMWWMPPAVELHMITVGAAPGGPAGIGVDSGVGYRISMEY